MPFGSFGRQGVAFGVDGLFRADVAKLTGDDGIITDDYYISDVRDYQKTAGTFPAVPDDNFDSGLVLNAPNGGVGTAYLYPAQLVSNPALAYGVAGANIALLANASLRPWATGSLLAIKGAPAAGTNIWVTNLTTNATDQIGLRLSGATSTTVLRMICDGTVSGPANGVTNTACGAAGTLGAGIVAANFNRFVQVWKPASGELIFGCNGVEIGRIVPAGNMPTAQMGPNWIVSGAAGMCKVATLWWGWQTPTA